jgi:hypothetical protein
MVTRSLVPATWSLSIMICPLCCCTTLPLICKDEIAEPPTSSVPPLINVLWDPPRSSDVALSVEEGFPLIVLPSASVVLP